MKIIIATAVALAAGAGAAVIPVAAHADPGTRGCVTRAELRQVVTHGYRAWTRDHVTREFGTHGRVTSTGTGGTTVEYRTCAGDPMWSYAEVDFSHHRADFKWIYISL